MKLEAKNRVDSIENNLKSSSRLVILFLISAQKDSQQRNYWFTIDPVHFFWIWNPIYIHHILGVFFACCTSSSLYITHVHHTSFRSMESSSLKRPVADPEGPILELLRVTLMARLIRLGLVVRLSRQIEQDSNKWLQWKKGPLVV